VIEVKKEFMLKRKTYPLLREEKEEVCKFIKEQLRKEYLKVTSNGTCIFCKKEGW